MCGHLGADEGQEAAVRLGQGGLDLRVVGLAQAGAGVARVALRKYTRSILVDRTGADLELADFSLVMGVIVPLIVAVIALAIAAWRLSNQDID